MFLGYEKARRETLTLGMNFQIKCSKSCNFPFNELKKCLICRLHSRKYYIIFHIRNNIKI